MLPSILIGLVVLAMLALQSIGTQAYPITSKPIEWTAENWAWQAWARQTSEEQSKGKARKVTPKSIFEIPYRNGCPPGHHSDSSRCIPTISIDPTELLNQQVLALVGDVNIGSNYEFDYDDDGSAIAEGLGFETSYNIYDPPQKFSSDMPTNTAQLPSEDAPLKFNFFEQKLSSNENETLPDNMYVEDDDYMPAVPTNNATLNQTNDGNNQTLKQVVQVFLNKEEENNQRNQLVNNNTLLHINSTLNTDLSKQNSNISTNLANNAFTIDNIDAISLPASVPLQINATARTTTAAAEHLVDATHKVSLYKGDNAVQLISSSSLLKDHQQKEEQQQTELAHLLQAEALLPLVNGNEKRLDNTTATTTGVNVTQVQTSVLSADFAEDMPNDEAKNKEKTDRTRSVSDSSLLFVNDLSAQEDDFTTTLEPDGTTSFQLDDTTIIEAVNPPTIELQELKAKRSREPSHEQQIHSVLEEKSKVEPVAQLSVDHEVTMTAATTAEISTTPLPTTSTHKSEIIDGNVDEDGNGVADVSENRFTYLDDDVANLISTTAESASAQAESTIISRLVKGTIVKTTAIPILETVAERSGTSATEFVATTTTTALSDSRHINKLTYNIEMETTTAATISVAHNNNKESSVTNADVDVNDDAVDSSEIVFVVENKKHLGATTAVESEESFMPTTTTMTNKEMTEIEAAVTTTQRTTSKRWSKVMPIFERRNKTDTTETTTLDAANSTQQLVDEATMNIEQIMLTEQQQLKVKNNIELAKLAPITEIVTTTSSEKRKSNRRNSKIIRFDKYPLAASVNSLSEPPTTTTTTTTPESSSRNQMDLDPFWWLPTSWHLDRHADVEGRPLLLRLWTTLTSDKHAKV